MAPEISLEECKVLKEYSKKYAVQRPHKDSESRSGGKTKCNKTINLDRSVKEYNIMEHYVPIPKKKNGKTLTKNRKN